MADSQNVKNNLTINESSTLTVVVLNEKNQPADGAHVSIEPSDNSGITNSAGEIKFKLGEATKYNITASYDSTTVTVPYYVTQGGATRLIINPTYVKSIEKKLHPSLLSSDFISFSGIGIGIIIMLVIFWKLLKRKRKTKN
jgi:hypothetical protein